MSIDIKWVGSPNFSRRTQPIKRIVIHWFGVGTLESANNRFQNRANQVSAHYGISNGRVWQWVKDTDVAWHSGVASVNANSIGIEHDATTTKRLSDVDYGLSGQLIAILAKKYNIPLDRKHIISHREVKATACSGTINLDRIIAIAKQINQPPLLTNSNNMFIKERNRPAVYALVGDVLIPFTDWAKFIADFDPKRIIEVDSSEIRKFKISKSLIK